MVQYGDASRQNKRNDFINFYQGIDVLIKQDKQEQPEETKKTTQKAKNQKNKQNHNHQTQQQTTKKHHKKQKKALFQKLKVFSMMKENNLKN